MCLIVDVGSLSVNYNDGPMDWSLGGNSGWVNKSSVDTYPCRWGRVVNLSGYANVYSNLDVNSQEVTSKGHKERVKNDSSGLGLLLIGQRGNFYRLRYHSYTNEDNIIKDRWILMSDIVPN